MADSIERIADEIMRQVQSGPTVDWRPNMAEIATRLRALSPAGGGNYWRAWLESLSDDDLRDIFAFRPDLAERLRKLLAASPQQEPGEVREVVMNNEGCGTTAILPSGQTLAGAGVELALNVRHPKCHEAANAFWNYWNANGETHRHGYYESTWGAINQALRVVGVIPHDYGDAAQPDGKRSMGPEKQPPEPRTDCVWPNCACDQPSKKCGEDYP